jgi:hypothetical protein
MNGRTDHANEPAKKGIGQTPSERGAAPGPKVTAENSVLREQAKRSSAGDGKNAEERERMRARSHDATQRLGEEGAPPRSAGERLYGEHPSEPRIGGNGGAATASIPTLLRDLASDATEITRKEVALARSEITHAIEGVKTGVISMATGGGVLFAGVLFLLLAATLALATVVDGWLAALIVGGVVTLIGAIMVSAGKRKMQASNFRPDRTLDSMQKDREMIERRTP